MNWKKLLRLLEQPRRHQVQKVPIRFYMFLHPHLPLKIFVEVNCGYDTCFGNGHVMGYADCKYLTIWLKHQSSFNWKLRPLSDTLQAGTWLPSGHYGLCFGYCFSGPLPLSSHKKQVTFLEPFLGIPTLLDYTGNWPELCFSKLLVMRNWNWPEPPWHWSSAWPLQFRTIKSRKFSIAWITQSTKSITNGFSYVFQSFESWRNWLSGLKFWVSPWNLGTNLD